MSLSQKLAQNLRPHPQRKEARGSIASAAVREADAMEAGDWRGASGGAAHQPSYKAAGEAFETGSKNLFTIY